MHLLYKILSICIISAICASKVFANEVSVLPLQGYTFRNQLGVPYAVKNGAVELRGDATAGESPVYAHVATSDTTTEVVGKLNLVTFEPKEINICLVPVNDVSLPGIQKLEKELNDIFRPAVASVRLSTAPSVKIQYADGRNFVHGGSGPLSVYSADEKSAIKALGTQQSDTYYLFMAKDVVKLDPDGNRTIVGGYMPVGRQFGFIFEQFDVASTIAHELSHGAFSLHHTFSDESESYHAPQGTTPNLMDYSGGTDLNHLQWQWMHESHTNLLGFLDDESEGESVLDQSVIQKYLTQIHSANVKNEKEMIIAKPSGFAQQLDLTLDGNKLSFIGFGEKHEGIAISLTSSLYETVSIKPNEIAEINYIENSIEYTKLSFHQAEHKTPMKEMVLTENTVFEIIVKASEAEVLKDYLFANMEYLMAKDQLTPQQIAIVRDGISNVEDETKRGELFLELQKKVPYHNQRDNNPSYKNKSVSKEVKTEKDRKYEADRMCNLTSVAMAFEMLGISKEDVYNKLVEDGFDVTSEKDKDFEDILDIVRVKKNFTLDRTKSELWEQIANYLGVEMTVTMVNSSKKNTNTINAINKALSEGKGVILSMYNNKGHIVRIQAISNDNIVVDDPYGNVSSMAYRELKPDHGESYQGSTNGIDIQNSSYCNGSNCTLTWDEIDVSKSSGRGGTYEVRGNQIYKSDLIDNDGKDLPEDQKKDYYVKDWINQRSNPGRNEYLTRTEIGNKTDRENNVVVDKNGKPITENITYYTAHGGMLKYYVVFSKKENKKQ